MILSVFKRLQFWFSVILQLQIHSMFVLAILGNRILMIKRPEDDIKLSLVIALILLSMTFLLFSVMIDPGLVPKMSLDHSQNALSLLCQQMDSKDAADLTQLDEMCLVCLTIKFRHHEHCSFCKRCVKGWHFHS